MKKQIILMLGFLLVMSFVSAGDVAIYRCYNSVTGDHMISLSSSCEGYTNEGLLGYLKSSETPEATVKIYRCFNSEEEDHMISLRSDCERNDYTNEGLLGYLSENNDGLGVLYRCVSPGTNDHMVTPSISCERSGYINDGILGYFPKEYVAPPVCTDSSWSPNPSTVCSSTSFIQTSNCGNTRTATGTRDCTPVCADNSWSPDFSTVCSGTPFTQTSNCGNIRNVVGTKQCSAVIVYGNGIIEGEECDDGNIASGDGCSATGTIETGYTCSGQPSVCSLNSGGDDSEGENNQEENKVIVHKTSNQKKVFGELLFGPLVAEHSKQATASVIEARVSEEGTQIPSRNLFLWILIILISVGILILVILVGVKK